MKVENIRIFKWALYALLLIAFCLIQFTPDVMDVLGIKPVLIVPLVVVAAAFREELGSVIFAAAAGLIWDTYTSTPFGFNAFVLAVFAAVISLLVLYLVRNNLLNVMAMVLGTMLLYELLRWLFFVVLFDGGNAVRSLVGHTLPTIVYTMAVSPFVYLLVAKLERKVA